MRSRWAAVFTGWLDRLVLNKLWEWCSTAHRVIAEAGFRIGFVNQVVETDALDTTVISGEYLPLFCFVYPACIKIDDRHMMSDCILIIFFI